LNERPETETIPFRGRATCKTKERWLHASDWVPPFCKIFANAFVKNLRFPAAQSGVERNAEVKAPRPEAYTCRKWTNSNQKTEGNFSSKSTGRTTVLLPL